MDYNRVAVAQKIKSSRNDTEDKRRRKHTKVNGERMKSFKELTEAFQKITVKDKSGKSHTHGAVRLRPGDTHVAIQHYDALPAKKAIAGLAGASAVKAHTVLSFGSIDKLDKVIAHAKKKFGLKKVEIQKIDKKYL